MEVGQGGGDWQNVWSILTSHTPVSYASNARFANGAFWGPKKRSNVDQKYIFPQCKLIAWIAGKRAKSGRGVLSFPFHEAIVQRIPSSPSGMSIYVWL